MTHTVSHYLQVWRTALQRFDPAATLLWLGLSLSLDQIVRQASILRVIGAFRDDSGTF